MIPLTRHRLDCIAHDPLRLPDYAGSLLRGAFGHALRRVACITRAKDCAPCPLRAGCPYTAVFAPGKSAATADDRGGIDIPAPYVIEPPEDGARTLQPGEHFHFHMVLIGRASAHLPIVTLAWQHALAAGLGAQRATASLQRMEPAPNAVSPALTSGQAPATARLHLATPLRLQENGRALPPSRLTPRALILACARRASLLARFHGDGEPAIDWTALAHEADTLRDERHLRWHDWTRYSSRQKATMSLGGVVGEWQLSGPIPQALPWLALGQQVHIGKETVFGLGRYALEIDPAEHKSAPARESCGLHAQATERKEEIA